MSGLNYENPRDSRDRNAREAHLLHLRDLDGPVGTSGSFGQPGASAKILNNAEELSRAKAQAHAKAAREAEMRAPLPDEAQMAMRSVMGPMTWAHCLHHDNVWLEAHGY